MDKHLKNALEQVELATSHLTIAIHEFTQAGAPTPENWTGVPKYDQAIFIIAKDIVEAVQMIQPTLSFLHEKKEVSFGILNEKKEVVPVRSMLEWADWLVSSTEEGRADKRRVAKTSLNGHCISTVFLGIDHGFLTGPLWFETMVFPEGEKPIVPELGGKLREYLSEIQLRYATYAEAEKGHETVVEMIRRGLF